MPSTGTPSSKTALDVFGTASPTTDSGPPERITPLGANFFRASSPMSGRCTSQNTPISRTRRAMSWVHWDPKSRIRMRSLCMFCWLKSLSPNSRKAAGCPSVHRMYSFAPIVRRFLGDGHVMDVALAHAGAGDAHELRPGAHDLD